MLDNDSIPGRGGNPKACMAMKAPMGSLGSNENPGGGMSISGNDDGVGKDLAFKKDVADS